MVTIAGETILIVDDDEDIRELVEMYLRKNNFRVITAADGTAVLDLITTDHPDLIILDVLMPGLDGFEVCQAIRKETDVPILFLSAKESDIDKILGLGVGGDDYMTKPFSPAELVARIKAHLRRNRTLLNKKTATAHNGTPHVLKFPNLEIDLHSYVVRVNGSPVTLPAKEFHLLSLLARHPNRVFSVGELFESVWGADSLGDNRTVMVHISNLRKKIEPDHTNPRYISTVRGIGYKFNNPPAD